MRDRTSGWVRFALVSAALATPLIPARAQVSTTLVGVVRDTAGQPISGVEVRLKGYEMATLTTELGGFRMIGVPIGPASVVIRRLGYVPVSHDVVFRVGRIDSLVVSLQMMATSLPGMRVEEQADARSHRLLAGFWERRSRGFGHYVTHDEIVAKDPHDFADIVRMLPGVMVTMKNGRRDIRMGRGGSPRGDCPPQFFVDGVRIEGGRADEFSAQDVEAVEVYAGPSTIPPQFAPRFNATTCGVIVIWSRVPGT